MIRFITRKWPPAVGGMEIHSLKLSQALAALAPLEVMALPGRADGSPPSAFALLRFGVSTALRLLFTRRPEGTVHIGDMASWPLALVAQLRSRNWRRVVSAHGTDVSYPRRGGFRGTAYGFYLKVGSRCLSDTIIIANSTTTAACTESYGFAPPLVIPLATALRTPSRPGPPEKFVLFAGRLVERKGCAWFIRQVLPRLPEDITLKVCGTLWSEAEGAALRDPRVAFLGPKTQDEVAVLYAQALCVVAPNIALPNGEFEGFGMVATEASACGGVSLAANIDGLQEAVVDNVTGFLLPSGDPDAWVGKISEVSSWSAQRRQEFLQRSMAEAHRRYTWERVAQETLAAYGRTENPA